MPALTSIGKIKADIEVDGVKDKAMREIVAVRRNPKTTGESPKTQPRYRGPIAVTEILPSDTYIISQLEPSNGRIYAQRPMKRFRNIADSFDRNAHNLYLNHTQATPKAEYVDYEHEETNCSSDISEAILNLNTYKPSTPNRLISLTDPKYKQSTPFVAKSSQMRLGLLSTPVVGDRCGVSDRAMAAIASRVLHDVGLITSNNSDSVVDKNKL
ncbi:hypothetical protein AVEN_38364-1 [Araneus ventricosus]|uniref:Uncharacterized protein n=1 Tax=Araneus ventricosus TaxID=182803 RepID=A0A4Y2J5Q5_ARAVE|nr:hypothetical protein AVEN_38364-1 [Araneus ventricosus]